MIGHVRAHRSFVFLYVAAVVALSPLGAAHAAPTMTLLSDLVASEGAACAAAIRLDDIVADPLFPDEALVWRFVGSPSIAVEITRDRHLVARATDQDWFGSADGLLTVCNPAGECATQTVSFRVEPVPDDPTIGWIPAQVIGAAGAFPPLVLGDYGYDVDGDEDMTWAVDAGAALLPEIKDGVLTVARRDSSWRGTETVRLLLTDSTGRTTARDVGYTVTDGVPVTLTFVPNRPLILQYGETRVLIDGLLRDLVALSDREKGRLERAEPPFDGVGLALATHEHFDHVTPRVVVEYLTHSPSTVFVSLVETVGLLRDVPGFASVADRTFAIPFIEGSTAEFEIPGARVTAFCVRHSGEGNNLAFLVELGGVRILVLGDAAFDFGLAEVAAFGWANLGIDVAVVPSRWIDTYGGVLVTQGIAPRVVIPGRLLQCPPHFEVPPGGAVPTVLCGSVETWIVAPRSD